MAGFRHASSSTVDTSCGCWVESPAECSSSELKVKSVRTTAKGGSSLAETKAVTATSFPMTLRPHDDVDDAVTTVEPDEINWALSPFNGDLTGFFELASQFWIFSGISSMLPLPLNCSFKIKAFSAQLFASFSEKHTPAVLNTLIFDATLFSDRAVHMGGAFTRPANGVNLPGSGVSNNGP